MSINSNIIKPAVPPKPKVPPELNLQGERWRRATDIIHRPEAGEEAAQSRKRQLTKHKSLPAVVNGNPTLERPASPVSVRPIPKPRRRWTEAPPNNQPLSESRVNEKKSVYERQSISTYITTTKPTCQSSCPCVCHRTYESKPKHDAHKLASPSEDYSSHLDYWHIVHPEKPRHVPPSIPLPSLPLLEMSEPSLSTTGECEDPDTLEAVYMEVASDNDNDSPMTSALTDSSNAAMPTCQSGNAKPSPCPRRKFLQSMMNVNCKITDSIHPDHQDMELICDVFLDELPKKVYQDCLEKQDTDTEKSKGKRNNEKLLRKRSLLELILFPFQSKPQANQVANQNDSAITCDSQKSAKMYTVKENSNSNTEKRPGAQEEMSSSAPEEEPEERKLEASVLPSRGRCPTLEEGLWRDRSIVKKRGILSQLSKEELLLQESLYEVLTSERTYLKSLDVVVEHFLESPELNQVLSPRDRKCLFSGISRIQQMSQNFLKDMKDELASNLFCNTCEVIQRYATGPFGAYVDYIRNLPYQEQTLHSLEQRSPQVSEILRKLQKDPRCNRLSLKSYLVLPFQRITRLKILVEAILKRTEPGSQGQASAERALKDVSKIVEACNHEVGRMKQMEEMVHIANKIEFECKALPLVSSSRWLLKQGDLAQLSVKENIFGQRKLYPIHLFLFNDMLLVTTRKGPDRFVVRDHVHRSLTEVSSVEDDADLDGCEHDKTFQLALLKNHRGGISHLLLQAPSQAEKASWMEMLTQRKDGEEEIYEEWDCPQVQCTVAYHAQQEGELSLQLGDVINIIQKTAKGFLEGWRSDGERGWFPAACTVEITNEHVQRRHLRQRYHVLQAANRVLCRRLGSDKSETTCLR